MCMLPLKRTFEEQTPFFFVYEKHHSNLYVTMMFFVKTRKKPKKSREKYKKKELREKKKRERERKGEKKDEIKKSLAKFGFQWKKVH